MGAWLYFCERLVRRLKCAKGVCSSPSLPLCRGNIAPGSPPPAPQFALPEGHGRGGDSQSVLVHGSIKQAQQGRTTHVFRGHDMAGVTYHLRDRGSDFAAAWQRHFAGVSEPLHPSGRSEHRCNTAEVGLAYVAEQHIPTDLQRRSVLRGFGTDGAFTGACADEGL